MSATREQLRAALVHLRTIFGLVMDAIDADPDETTFMLKAASPRGTRLLARKSVAECFAEVDALLLGDEP